MILNNTFQLQPVVQDEVYNNKKTDSLNNPENMAINKFTPDGDSSFDFSQNQSFDKWEEPGGGIEVKDPNTGSGGLKDNNSTTPGNFNPIFNDFNSSNGSGNEFEKDPNPGFEKDPNPGNGNSEPNPEPPIPDQPETKTSKKKKINWIAILAIVFVCYLIFKK